MGLITPQFIDYLRVNFRYDDGKLIYKRTNCYGYFDKSSGYFKQKVLGHSFLSHRLIFLYHHGYMPDMVDHEDKNKKNNKIENLRECPSKGHNTINSIARSDNTSGYKGVTWHKNVGKWHCSVFKGKKRYYVGIYNDVKEAALAYNVKAIELFGEFAHLNKVE